MGPAAFGERQPLRQEGPLDIGLPGASCSHREAQACGLTGANLPAGEEASPAGFLPACRVSNLGR